MEGRRAIRWRHYYGITKEQHAALMAQQYDLCAGCHRPLDGGRNDHVDHCHRTMRVRGILCLGCNTALGGAADNPETLERLAHYLRRSSGENH